MKNSIHTIGRRKTAVARMYMRIGKGLIKVNNIYYKKYFTTNLAFHKISIPLILTETKNKINSQAEAISLALSRALCKFDINNKPFLKENNLLTRDPRMVERKKYGKKKSRKKFQFSKR
ncbi:30S ribosomal protein S9 [Candidatus Sulcia muelleri]|uniref:30S ribosomal protein S9 n=1 Tax=Candidatus Karelsulcia muelleri TaxID=336810 RepID=UPI001F8C6823|nr:30S ribosomal protein S9 [Candidatus Karelsulcia muelleri]NHU72390.1 30S ribosomal protein S9 [Candidatus Karelsulcia muelleri]